MANSLLPPEERNLTPDQVEALDKRRDLGHTLLVIAGQFAVIATVLLLWIVAGAGGAYQLAAAAAFVQALSPSTRASAFGLAQSGLYAVQGLGILAGGALAQAIGAPLAVALAGLVGLTAATRLAMSWTRLRLQLIAAQRG